MGSRYWISRTQIGIILASLELVPNVGSTTLKVLDEVQEKQFIGNKQDLQKMLETILTEEREKEHEEYRKSRNIPHEGCGCPSDKYGNHSYTNIDGVCLCKGVTLSENKSQCIPICQCNDKNHGGVDI